jgi:hypothetical protein
MMRRQPKSTNHPPPPFWTVLTHPAHAAVLDPPNPKDLAGEKYPSEIRSIVSLRRKILARERPVGDKYPSSVIKSLG